MAIQIGVCVNSTHPGWLQRFGNPGFGWSRLMMYSWASFGARLWSLLLVRVVTWAARAVRTAPNTVPSLGLFHSLRRRQFIFLTGSAFELSGHVLHWDVLLRVAFCRGWSTPAAADIKVMTRLIQGLKSVRLQCRPCLLSLLHLGASILRLPRNHACSFVNIFCGFFVGQSRFAVWNMTNGPSSSSDAAAARS